MNAKQADSDMGNMFFSAVTYQLYPEDVKIINTLPEDERTEYIQKCIHEGRYTRIAE